ncbi:conserved hypothetical protein [delta proteobacterium NaphS2]|nr:conserved hypothetical protein [delta proteobacterium NaphS2]
MSKKKQPISKGPLYKQFEPFLPSKPDTPFYPVKEYDSLSKIEMTITTQSLIEKTSLNIVKCGVRVYRIMKAIEDAIDPLTQEDLEKAGAKAVEALRINNSFSAGPDEDLPTISFGNLLRSILEKDPYQARRIALGQLQKSFGRPTDIPMHIFIFYLREHLKACTGKFNNDTISGFLLEQDLGEIAPDGISKRMGKSTHERLQEAYELYLDIYEIPIAASSSSLEDLMAGFENVNRIAADHPTEIRDTSLFPTWKNYLPEITA